MENTLLDDFERFFAEFQRIWNSCHTEEMVERLSPDIAVRWSMADGTVSDWGYKEAVSYTHLTLPTKSLV